ncbi:hypothetical protein [Symbiobacterium terraclitae]|jgi:hypothetical protein|uniref:hypothetical protein n=1 Tax=Symbiobacterium terraclitae TaxID=557451 RepID=UPI0035B510B4
MRLALLMVFIAATLVGCGATDDITQLPEAVTFTPITETTDFAIDTELVLEPHPEEAAKGQATLQFRFESLMEEDLTDLRVAVFYPEQMAHRMLIPEKDAPVFPISGRRFDVTPSQPAWRITHTFAPFDWDQVETVRDAVLNPIRLRIVWEGDERFLEVPPSEIRVRTQGG